jgi:DNA polymerase-1
VKSTGQTHGYVHNFLHRKFSCTRDTSYKLPNHLIQGSGADVIKVAMVKLYEYLLPKKSNMILQVHDELLFEIHKRELDIIEDIKDIMTNVYPSKNGIKLSVEETYYKSWGEPHGQEARDIV